jgi:hypothetical protein
MNLKHENRIVLEVYCQILITDLRNLLLDCSKKIDQLTELVREVENEKI